jgi:hypothetical protein
MGSDEGGDVWYVELNDLEYVSDHVDGVDPAVEAEWGEWHLEWCDEPAEFYEFLYSPEEVQSWH